MRYLLHQTVKESIFLIMKYRLQNIYHHMVGAGRVDPFSSIFPLNCTILFTLEHTLSNVNWRFWSTDHSVNRFPFIWILLISPKYQISMLLRGHATSAMRVLRPCAVLLKISGWPWKLCADKLRNFPIKPVSCILLKY